MQTNRSVKNAKIKFVNPHQNNNPYASIHLQHRPLHRIAITGFACKGLCGLERQNKELSKFNRHIKAI